MKTKKVTPVRTEMRPAFVDGPKIHELRMMPFEVYPPSRGKELREERLRLDLGLREAARRLGVVRVAEYCDLERGARGPEDWDEALRLLRGEGAR
jgi:hypothetical protein